ncbi:MAG TPA: diguanylate cyclase [Burkholderiaceae bacterium]|nr:diguanylate cyclase [Burkholderiaceae bacterium]
MNRQRPIDVRARLNAWLALTCVTVFCATSAALYRLEMSAAMTQVRREALVQMQMALAMRQYTIEDVRPLLSDRPDAFHLPAIPAYASVRAMALMRQFGNPQADYQELVLDPTNPAHRASGWQLAVIRQFNDDPQSTEWSRVLETPRGRLMQIARPVRPTPDCLTCHGAPTDAPAAMRALYGDQHGFNWKLGAAVGIQLVTVPATDAIANARAAWWRYVVANIVALAAVFVVLNRVLSRNVIAPIERRSTALRRLAGTDALTGALNRRSFEGHAAAVLARRATDATAPTTLVLIDIDHFKRINDRHGHDGGDRVLKEFALRLAHHCRPGEGPFRLGGEEFAVLLAHTAIEAGLQRAEALRQVVASSPFNGIGPLTASFGVATVRGAETLASVLKRADRALYLAKERGRNRVAADSWATGVGLR